MPAYSFHTPPGPGSSPRAIERFWSDVKHFATDAQKAALGPAPDDLPQQQSTLIPYDGGQNYRQFAAAEAAKDKKPYDWLAEYHDAGTRALRQEALMGYTRTRADRWHGGRVDAAIIAACLKEIQDPAKLIEARAWVKSKAGRA